MAIALKSVATPGSSYGSSPDLDLSSSFAPRFYRFAVQGAANDRVAISFDGKNDHLALVVGTNSEILYWKTGAQKVWVKKLSGAPTNVDIMAGDGG